MSIINLPFIYPAHGIPSGRQISRPVWLISETLLKVKDYQRSDVKTVGVFLRRDVPTVSENLRSSVTSYYELPNGNLVRSISGDGELGYRVPPYAPTIDNTPGVRWGNGNFDLNCLERFLDQFRPDHPAVRSRWRELSAQCPLVLRHLNPAIRHLDADDHLIEREDRMRQVDWDWRARVQAEVHRLMNSLCVIDGEVCMPTQGPGTRLVVKREFHLDRYHVDQEMFRHDLVTLEKKFTLVRSDADFEVQEEYRSRMANHFFKHADLIVNTDELSSDAFFDGKLPGSPFDFIIRSKIHHMARSLHWVSHQNDDPDIIEILIDLKKVRDTPQGDHAGLVDLIDVLDERLGDVQRIMKFRTEYLQREVAKARNVVRWYRDPLAIAVDMERQVMGPSLASGPTA
jgi:hypothetical protein